MSTALRLFTSESVTEGHPDKICDQISDSILDALLTVDPQARVAVETLVTTGLVHVAGEVTTSGYVDIPSIVRQRISDIGYNSSDVWFDGRSCGVSISIGGQSPDIAQGVDNAIETREGSSKDRDDLQGAGDQGLMFGYATTETPQLMPIPIWLAHRLAERLAEVRKTGLVDYLRPDGKTQVTIGYEGTVPRTVETVVVSAQHSPLVSTEQLTADLTELVIRPVLARVDLVSTGAGILINPTGRFEIGGPQGDAGLTGRKIIVDTYGGASRHGGGAFSGKDPSKVDRSAAYAMRWVAKNAVAAGLADRLEVQVAYAIGKASPVGLYVESFGTGRVPEDRIIDAINAVFDLRPGAIIRDLDLLRPIYAQTATYGHFGRELPDFTWERTDRVEALRTAAGILAMGSGPLIARVLVDSPLPQLDRLFDYGIPETLRDAAIPGVRVRVPLRSAGRIADGFIVELAEPGDYPGVLSELDSVVSPIPVLSPEVWSLARRASERAAGSAIDIVRLAVPGRQVRVEKAYLADRSNRPFAVVAAPPIESYGSRVIESAIALGERLAVDAIPFVKDVGGGHWVGGWAVTLAAAAASVLAAGGSAILAVPDYRDQEQLEAALRAILPSERIVRLDARQSNPDRYRAFLRCLTEEALVIVGNRSAVYAPAANLGLIAVWDDGDPLHSEPLSPYVHTRDAALLRQEQQGCALVVMGNTRSTEVERLVEIGWLRSISPERLVLPKIVPTMRQGGGDRLAAQARIPSSAWSTARAALESGPVLVQVARPGYAPRLACADCGQTARCLRCEGPLAQKSARSVPACLWCGALAANWQCSTCDGEKLRFVGNGATRTAEDLGRAFPGVKVIIADGERQVLTVDGEPALVIATRGAEPVAAGGYRAVLLLDGERMVARESLRVGEDCLRWWSNAVALAAGGATTMLVGVGGTLAGALVTWRHADYARAELADRRRLRFPPAVRVATVTGTVEAVSTAIAGLEIEPLDVLGPVDLDTGGVRTIIRFDYARGQDVAAHLRAEVIRAATSRRRPAVARATRTPLPPILKVRLDDVEPFLES